MMRICHKWLSCGVSVLIFPEGTRSADGSVQGFHDGAFRLAKLCNVRVLPIAITGTHAVLPKGSKVLNIRGEMKIKILPPLSPSEFGGSTERMKNHVRNQIKQLVEQDQAVYQPAAGSAQKSA
jgi:1-acyl-sn-glycerol-3-phosphate acyltransferase